MSAQSSHARATSAPHDTPATFVRRVDCHLMAASVCGYDAGRDKRMTISTNPPEPALQSAKAPLWLRIPAFLLIMAALWVVALFALITTAPVPEGVSWQLLIAILPAVILAALLARARSARVLVASIIVTWLLGAPALYLGSQQGGWP